MAWQAECALHSHWSFYSLSLMGDRQNSPGSTCLLTEELWAKGQLPTYKGASKVSNLGPRGDVIFIILGSKLTCPSSRGRPISIILGCLLYKHPWKYSLE